MGSALDINLKVIPAKVANPFIDRVHYSGKHVNNSQLHFGAFLNGRLHGVMSFGPPMVKSKVIGLVEGTPWNGMLELNRMAFDDVLPRNSESRCISLAMKLLKKNAPHVKWVLSFADGCSCGDGTIYRASNFILTGIKRNKTVARLPDGTEITDVALKVTRTRPREELGGAERGRVLRAHPVLLRRVLGGCWRKHKRGLHAPLHLLHRQAMAQAPDGARAAVLGDSRGRCRDVQGREALMKRGCREGTARPFQGREAFDPTHPLQQTRAASRRPFRKGRRGPVSWGNRSAQRS